MRKMQRGTAGGAKYCPYCGKKQITEEKRKHGRSRPNGTGSVYRRGKTWERSIVLGAGRG